MTVMSGWKGHCGEVPAVWLGPGKSITIACPKCGLSTSRHGGLVSDLCEHWNQLASVDYTLPVEWHHEVM